MSDDETRYYRFEKPYETFDTVHEVRRYNPKTNELTTKCGMVFSPVIGMPNLKRGDVRDAPDEVLCGRCNLSF